RPIRTSCTPNPRTATRTGTTCGPGAARAFVLADRRVVEEQRRQKREPRQAADAVVVGADAAGAAVAVQVLPRLRVLRRPDRRRLDSRRRRCRKALPNSRPAVAAADAGDRRTS